MEINRQFINVIVLGLAFMLIFTAFQTMGNIQVHVSLLLYLAWQICEFLNNQNNFHLSFCKNLRKLLFLGLGVAYILY